MNANNSNYITEADESKPPQPKAEHTPAPWIYRPSPEDSITIDQHYWVDTEGHSPIANIYGRADGEDEANARLISQAPAMLEALEDLISIAEATHGAQDRVNKARAVIAKAKGE